MLRHTIPMAALLCSAALFPRAACAADDPELQQLRRGNRHPETRLRGALARARGAAAADASAARRRGSRRSFSCCDGGDERPARSARTHGRRRALGRGQRLQPGHVADPLGQLRPSVARPGRLCDRGLPARRRDRPGHARLQPRRIRARLRARASTRGSAAPPTSRSHADNTVSVEEAYVQTTALRPRPRACKRGRFFSGIGYLNEQHAHTWDFVDAPLAYQAFLGGQFGDGRPAAAVARADRALRRARRRGRARRRLSRQRREQQRRRQRGALRAHRRRHRRQPQLARRRVVPRCEGRATARSSASTRPATSHATPFNGSTRGCGSPMRSGSGRRTATRTRTNFKLQGEYFRARERARLVLRRRAAPTSADAIASTQSGWYLQGVYQFMPRWRVGAALRPARPRQRRLRRQRRRCSPLPDFTTAQEHAAMLDCQPERVLPRAAAARARPRARTASRDNQCFLQYLLSLGAHGAHKLLRRSTMKRFVHLCRRRAAARCSRMPRRARRLERASPASPSGARSRRSSAATRSRSPSPPMRCRTRITIQAQAEPHRARAQRRPRRLHRRRARDRLAAAGDAAVRQRRRCSPGSPATSRPRDFVRSSRCRRGSIARKATCIAAGNPHIQTDPRNIARVADGARARAWRSSIAANAAYYAKRAGRFAQRWQQAIARWEQQAAPLQGRAGRRRSTRPSPTSTLARPEGGRGARAQARRRADRVAPAARCSRAEEHAGEDGVRAAYQDDRAVASGSRERTQHPGRGCPSPSAATTARKDLFGLFDDTVARLLAGGARHELERARLEHPLPALVAGLLVLATHVPLGMQVLDARHRLHRPRDRADRRAAA